MATTTEKTPAPPELWQVTKDWLMLLGNHPNTKFCREEISTHPDYPGMTAVTDFLDAGGMAYNAMKADRSCLHEFNYPLLAHIRSRHREFIHIIDNSSEWDKQKDITQHWTGVVLFPEKDSKWQNEQNTAYQKEAVKSKLLTALLIASGLGLLIITSINGPLLTLAFGLLSLLGLIISLVLVGSELGYQSQAAKRVCGTVSPAGCEKVLKSKYAEGFLGVSPAVGAAIYFSVQYAGILTVKSFPNVLQVIFLFANAGMIITAWSFYTQAVKLKQWCALCLCVAIVLVLQALIGFAQFGTLKITYSMLPAALSFVFLLFVLYALFYPVKAFIKNNNANKQKLAELKKWKSDLGLFIRQWQNEPHVDTSIWQNDLVIGDRKAPVLITVACNPYCDPCAKAHLQLDRLLQRFPGKIKIQMRLLCKSAIETDLRTIAVKAILQKAAVTARNNDLQQMFTDWFAWTDLDKWNAKWKPDNAIDVSHSLEAHEKWMNPATIPHTPTYFINGRKLPGRYSLHDIEYLIPQLAEMEAR